MRESTRVNDRNQAKPWGLHQIIKRYTISDASSAEAGERVGLWNGPLPRNPDTSPPCRCTNQEVRWIRLPTKCIATGRTASSQSRKGILVRQFRAAVDILVYRGMLRCCIGGACLCEYERWPYQMAQVVRAHKFRKPLERAVDSLNSVSLRLHTSIRPSAVSTGYYSRKYARMHTPAIRCFWLR